MHKVIIWDLLGLIECIYIFKIMNMSKECMSSNRMSEQYRIGVTNFVSHSKAIFGDSNFVKCSCSSCGNTRRMNVDQIEPHLFFKGFDLSYNLRYTKWVYHGESCPTESNLSDGDFVEEGGFNDSFDSHFVSQMVEDVQEELLDNPQEFQ